jgi:hypothetical protein
MLTVNMRVNKRRDALEQRENQYMQSSKQSIHNLADIVTRR